MLQVNAPWFGQMLLGPATELPAELNSWQSWPVGDSILNVCPSVPIVHAKNEARQIWILGQAFSGEAVETTDTFAERLILNPWNRGVPNQIESLVGRFLIVLLEGTKIQIVPDPFTTFNIEYGRDAQNRFWASSEIKLLRHLNVFETNSSPEWLWTKAQNRFQALTGNPMQITALQGVFSLMRNHFITNERGSTPQRFFPRRKKPNFSAPTVRELIRHQIQTAFANAENAGNELWFSVTAGQDSRLLMSLALNAFKNQIIKQKPKFYFIDKRDKSVYQKSDIAFVHKLIEAGYVIDICPEKDAKTIADLNYDAQRWHSPRCHLTRFLPVNNGLDFPQHKLYANGICGEMIRLWDNEADVRNLDKIAILSKLPNHPIINDFLKAHFNRHQEGFDSTGYQWYEMTYWELLHSFAAKMTHYGNIAMPYWCPFNSWQFYEWGLSLELKERGRPLSRFFWEAIQEWSPDLAKYPINPHYRNKAIGALQFFHLYKPYRNFTMARRWKKDGKMQRRAERQNLK